MDINYNELVDDNLIDQCDQIRSIAKKSWLTGAAVSLAHLDNVKTNVYNFGLADPRDLKATNLRNRKPAPVVDNLGTAPPLSITSSVAWGSNSSIPDLLRQHNGERAPLPKPTRPGSAKYSNTRIRPPSGKKPRPQSAKEPVPDVVSEETQQGFGVKGAKYDPNGRPPKGVPHTTTTGWVGPPAGLKYPDKPPPGAGWKMEFPTPNSQEDLTNGETDYAHYGQDEREVPPPPYTTPTPPTPEPELEPDKPKRVFELFIGDPYSLHGQDDEDFYDDVEEELTFASTTTDHAHSSSTNQIGSSPDNHSHSATHHTDGSTPNSRLAESRECLKLDLPIADDDYDEMDEVDTERLLAEAESVSEKLDLKRIISINKTLGEPSDNYTDTGHPESESPEVNRHRAENLVNTIIHETGLSFDQNKHTDAKTNLNKTSHNGDNTKQNVNKKKHISGIGDRSTLDHEKSSVKFNEAITTVNITPRNMGRKVDELHSKRKTYPTRDSDFIDLIEVKNRMEPVLATGKVDMAPCKPRPQSGKSRTAKSSHTVNKHTDARSDRSVSPSSCYRNHETMSQVKTREPLNRAHKVVTTVTVDYGEEEKKENQDKPKKKTRKSDDVVTMMEKINLQDNRLPTHVPNIQEFDANRTGLGEILLETKCKSEPEKNYYEISRHSSMSNVSAKSDFVSTKGDIDCPHKVVGSSVYKTTKTIEFNETEPKEVIVKSVVDAPVVTKDNKEYRVKPPSRPSSAKPPPKKPVDSSASERPGSRLGFVAMTPNSDRKDTQHRKTLTRPSSAQTNRRPTSAKRADKLNKGKTYLTEVEKEEREQVIDNLLERTRSMLEHDENKKETVEPKKETVEKKKVRPASAHVGLAARMKEQNRVKSAVTRRPVSATTTTNKPSHKHYASYATSSNSASGSRKSSAKKTKVIKTDPCIITTNTPYMDEESETEEDMVCEEMHKQLAEKGVNIAADTLQRALYPPTGRTKYYHITADLPKQSSISLLSHPKFWLSEEYKRLQKAEKTLARANEIMYLQEKAEKRRAMLEGLTPEERKKLLKKKGKKGGKKLRRSKTVA